MDLTLPQVKDRLLQVHNDLAQAQDMLRAARDAEVDKAAVLRMARAAAMLDPSCPRPKRGENGVTVADRDAWLDRMTADDLLAAEVAEATRKSAEDHMRVTRDQASLVQSLAGLLKVEASLAGSMPV